MLKRLAAQNKPEGGIVVVQGHAGTGKTLLSGQICKIAKSDAYNLPTIFTAASELESEVSYFAFRDVISQLLCQLANVASVSEIDIESSKLKSLNLFQEATDGYILTVIVQELCPVSKLKGLGLTKQQLVDKLHRIVNHLFCLAPSCVIVIDDAQWMDLQSWNLLRHFSRNIEADAALSGTEELLANTAGERASLDEDLSDESREMATYGKHPLLILPASLGAEPALKHLFVIVTRVISDDDKDDEDIAWIIGNKNQNKKHLLSINLDKLDDPAIKKIIEIALAVDEKKKKVSCVI